jgi:ATP-binding cassette subfamily C (CFTR/MRP) protein 1
VREDRRLIEPIRAVAEPQGKSSASTAPLKTNEIEMEEMKRYGNTNTDKEVLISVHRKFSWPETTTPVISIDRWIIKRSSVTLVLGPVGFGKTTLLRSLIGELSDFKGTISTAYRGVSYCSQTPWIPNGRIQVVVLASADIDEQWYQTVLQACALEEDIRGWEKADEPRAGSNGIALSGGQKQRLALARAVYARKELIVLDDVFSGLNARTEDAVS